VVSKIRAASLSIRQLYLYSPTENSQKCWEKSRARYSPPAYRVELNSFKSLTRELIFLVLRGFSEGQLDLLERF
jgi:hypothetical protein